MIRYIQIRRADGKSLSRSQVWNHIWQQIGIWSSILVALLPELRAQLADWFSAWPWIVPLLIALIKAVDMYYRATTNQALKDS